MRQYRSIASVAIGLVICLGLQACPLRAAIVQTGDVRPDITSWSSLTGGLIGVTSDGGVLVDAGSILASGSGFLGNSSSSTTGTAMISGAGSRWTNSNDIYVGLLGSGTLDITSGGLVSVRGALSIDNDSDGDGVINMATGGMLALFGDADDSLSQFLDLVNGTDAIRYWDASLGDWALLTSATYGDDYTLSYITEGDLAGYTLLTVGLVPEPGAAVLASLLASLAFVVARHRRMLAG